MAGALHWEINTRRSSGPGRRAHQPPARLHQCCLFLNNVCLCLTCILPCPCPACSSGSSSSSEEYSSGSGRGSEGEGVADPDAQTAWEVGLNGGDLMPDEAGLLPPGADAAAYVRVSRMRPGSGQQRPLRRAPQPGASTARVRPGCCRCYRCLLAQQLMECANALK